MEIAYFVRQFGSGETKYLDTTEERFVKIRFAGEFETWSEAAQVCDDWKDHASTKGTPYSYDVQAFDSHKGTQGELL